MDANALDEPSISLGDAENWLALGAGALLLLVGASRRSAIGTCLAVTSAPVADVYRFWRRLDNLPRFMTHLNRVTEIADGRSHWVANGPAGLTVERDAELINEIENKHAHPARAHRTR